MHRSAFKNGQIFFETYFQKNESSIIVDLGAQDINGSLRNCAPSNCHYLGIDFVAGRGVDIVLDDPYHLPLGEASVDAVVSSSCFEHIEFFWLMFNEVMRVLKPSGLFYLNAPSNGDYHRYPVDCWRFYPDAGEALARWGRKSGFDCILLESFTAYQDQDIWSDSVAVFLKDEKMADCHKLRMLDRIDHYMNGRVYGNADILAFQSCTEDRLKIAHR
ncbi:methyltransferase domain-containing protein [Delftia sp. PS-11]|uniref:methyltransferase domain-containing protein n=1 Tax=Delftia sp. PS-11 TaxID=2767222 RepID=UPI00245797EE|nr:methyltransferase domain-containing protein [Delftia sp. PS-11]KAJ8746419.1 methyltransferase domain-containing protein [Delftia sp. PS-11]